MKKTVGTIISAIILTVGVGLTAYAAPKEMNDGGIFDAEYYAQTNPDVVNVVGNDEKALYEHYKVFGKKEGRKAISEKAINSSDTIKVELKSNDLSKRTKLAKATKCSTNDNVIAGKYLNLPPGAEKTSGTTSTGVYWESSWYLHYRAAWSYIHGAYSYADDKAEFTNGAILSTIVNENLSTDGVMMLLDFGYFADYLPQLKAKGLVPSSYQLPSEFYQVTLTGGKLKSGYYKIATDCPEAMAFYESDCYWIYRTGSPVKTFDNYTPKYLRDQMK